MQIIQMLIIVDMHLKYFCVNKISQLFFQKR